MVNIFFEILRSAGIILNGKLGDHVTFAQGCDNLIISILKVLEVSYQQELYYSTSGFSNTKQAFLEVRDLAREIEETVHDKWKRDDSKKLFELKHAL